MGTQLTFSPEARKALGLGPRPTADEVIGAVTSAVGERRRARLAAADAAGGVSEDALYDGLYPPPAGGPSDPTAGLSAEDAATYRAVFGD